MLSRQWADGSSEQEPPPPRLMLPCFRRQPCRLRDTDMRVAVLSLHGGTPQDYRQYLENMHGVIHLRPAASRAP